MLGKIYYSSSSEMTKQLAKTLAEKLWCGSCLLLSGDLGAGKTTFTQGLALGLGVKRTVNSPTFTMLKVYEEGRLPLYHLDCYRLEGAFQDVGFSEFIAMEGVTVIEWPEFIVELLPKEYLKIEFKYIDEEKRSLLIRSEGESYTSLIEEVLC